MTKEEYYKRLEKTTEKIKTDRCSEDEIANINRQKLYLAEHYISSLEEKNQRYEEVIFKIKMVISARIKEYQKKIDNEIDMGSQGDHFKICRYEENIKFLKDILKEVK